MPRVLPDYKAQARARIARAGLALFAKKGFEKTKMEDIAREVGVSKADLYLYFPSKLELLREIQLTSQREAREHLGRLLKASDWPDAALQLLDRVLGEANAAGLATQWFDLMAQVAIDPKVGEILRADFQEDRRLVRAFLMRSPRAGRPRTPAEVDRTALLLMMLFHGAIVQAGLGTRWPETRRALREGIRAVLER